MSEIIIEHGENADQPQLHALWEHVFGDDTETILTFFDRFPPEVAAWVARDGERIVSAAHLLPGSWLLSEDCMQAVGYVYAVATLPEERGKGYAGKLMQTIRDFADQRSLLLYTRPAEDGLFPWYAEHMEADQIGYAQEIEYTAVEAAALEVKPIEALEYQALRESIFGSAPHLLLSEALLRVQKQFFETAGGGLLRIGDGCGGCELRDGKLYVHELIGVDEDAAMQTLMAYFGVASGILRKPADESGIPVVTWRGTAPNGTNWGLFLE